MLQRDTKILEKLKRSQGPIEKAVNCFIISSCKTISGGAAGGTTAGILFGDEETDLLYWFAGGAALGQIHKNDSKK